MGTLSDWPGEKHGHLKAFSADDILYEEADYRNDTLHGYRKIYFPDGKLRVKEAYVNGKFHGANRER